jgi:hypothetical protein
MAERWKVNLPMSEMSSKRHWCAKEYVQFFAADVVLQPASVPDHCPARTASPCSVSGLFLRATLKLSATQARVLIVGASTKSAAH